MLPKAEWFLETGLSLYLGYYTLSQKSLSLLFLWLLSQMLTDFYNIL